MTFICHERLVVGMPHITAHARIVHPPVVPPERWNLLLMLRTPITPTISAQKENSFHILAQKGKREEFMNLPNNSYVSYHLHNFAGLKATCDWTNKPGTRIAQILPHKLLAPYNQLTLNSILDWFNLGSKEWTLRMQILRSSYEYPTAWWSDPCRLI